jgi:hypothetical protein
MVRGPGMVRTATSPKEKVNEFLWASRSSTGGSSANQAQGSWVSIYGSYLASHQVRSELRRGHILYNPTPTRLPPANLLDPNLLSRRPEVVFTAST